jgi:hypothetical protein
MLPHGTKMPRPPGDVNASPLAIWPTLLVEADVNGNQREAGEKPLSTLNSK